jgi:WD40 repeat protein
VEETKSNVVRDTIEAQPGTQHEDAVWSVVWSASGSILSGSVDGTVKVW